MSPVAAESSDSASPMAPSRALSFPRTQRQRNWDATSSGEARCSQAPANSADSS
jgi:hypothetical protein